MKILYVELQNQKLQWNKEKVRISMVDDFLQEKNSNKNITEIQYTIQK